MEQQDTGQDDVEETTARAELKRAYMLAHFGRFDEAIACCQKAAEIAPDHVLPPTMEGAFLTAAGRNRKALGHLRKVVKRFSDEPLPRLHFAEACLLAGRVKKGFGELDAAVELDEEGEHAELAQLLRETFDGLDKNDIPDPLEV